VLLISVIATTLARCLLRPNGEQLIQAMLQRYAGKWYKTLTFVQTTSFPQTGKVETWYEAAKIPGALRIDVAPIDSGRTILFRNDSIYQFKGGKLAGSKGFVHPLMVLGFDVYNQPADATISKLKDLGFDLSKLRTDTWQGHPVYVVGAAQGDSTTAQFWIDQERLLFVRMIEPAPGRFGCHVRNPVQQVPAARQGMDFSRSDLQRERQDDATRGLRRRERVTSPCRTSCGTRPAGSGLRGSRSARLSRGHRRLGARQAVHGADDSKQVPDVVEVY
jgi:hypothetical protein